MRVFGGVCFDHAHPPFQRAGVRAAFPLSFLDGAQR